MGDGSQLNGLFFGGWNDYQQWADHDFPLKVSAEPDPPPVDSDSRPLVRPYTRTGGRTRPVHSLELETLLSFSPAWQVDLDKLRTDHRAICVACQTPQSTAELAVHLGLPLGAARVLIADVVELGLIHVHELDLVGSRPSMDLLERVHAGLLKL